MPSGTSAPNDKFSIVNPKCVLSVMPATYRTPTTQNENHQKRTGTSETIEVAGSAESTEGVCAFVGGPQPNDAGEHLLLTESNDSISTMRTFVRRVLS